MAKNGTLGHWVAAEAGAEHVLTSVGPGTNLWALESGSAGPRLAATILIVDDCTLYRENLSDALSANGASSMHAAWDMPSLLTAFDACTPDVVLLSMSTKNSASLLHAMIEAQPGVKVIAVGVWEGDESTIVASAEAGVTGYHLRDESFADLLLLIREVLGGESVCSPKVAAVLLRRLSVLASARKPDTSELVLTAREMEILGLLEIGLSNREIANQLCIALHTVKNHVHSVLGKLGVSTRAQAVAASRAMRQDDMGLRA
ncbi:response regulator transcription factor [Mycobacterium yunnanensis]|uniref:response regulator transcription factor n=1 Tax=Mycobacterium yunnanensis TaxID=368477 RepID=UPI0021F3552C|nr:response regulator transcription factor [Mycobacterium yunnanensis]